MSPKRSAAATRETHRAIVRRAVDLASAENLESVTLGRLADELQMSKAGVIGHFGTMEALHVETVAAAVATFQREVWDPAASRSPGLERLRSICDRWIRYLESESYVGACLTSAELSGSPVVREAVASALGTWRRVLAADVQAAIDAGDLPADLDPRDVAFDLGAIALATGQALRLGLDRSARARGRRSMRRILGDAGR
jgi:AcrR family transcriptional regulator